MVGVLIAVIAIVGMVRVVVVCEAWVLVGCLLQGYAVVYQSVVVWGCDVVVWLPSCMIDLFRRARGHLLCFLVLFPFCEACTLLGCVPLS